MCFATPGQGLTPSCPFTRGPRDCFRRVQGVHQLTIHPGEQRASQAGLAEWTPRTVGRTQLRGEASSEGYSRRPSALLEAAHLASENPGQQPWNRQTPGARSLPQLYPYPTHKGVESPLSSEIISGWTAYPSDVKLTGATGRCLVDQERSHWSRSPSADLA